MDSQPEADWGAAWESRLERHPGPPRPVVRLGEPSAGAIAFTGRLRIAQQDAEIPDATNAGRERSASQGLNLHHFCRRCGCNTHGDSPDWASAYNADGTPKEGDGSVIPTQRTFGVNMRMVDDLDLTRLPIEKVDGRNSW